MNYSLGSEIIQVSNNIYKSKWSPDTYFYVRGGKAQELRKVDMWKVNNETIIYDLALIDGKLFERCDYAYYVETEKEIQYELKESTEAPNEKGMKDMKRVLNHPTKGNYYEYYAPSGYIDRYYISDRTYFTEK